MTTCLSMQMKCTRLMNLLCVIKVVLLYITQPIVGRKRDILRVDPESYKVFYSFEDVMAVFNKKQYFGMPAVEAVLEEWKKHTDPVYKKPKKNWMYIGITTPKPVKTRREYPFVLVEGVQKSLKETVGKKIARCLHAKHVKTTPRLMRKFKRRFNKWLDLKRAFVGLGIYVRSFDLMETMDDRPILLSGYWANQAAWYIAQSYKDLPPPNSSLYEWPKDLTVPDIVFFTNAPKTIMKDDPELMTLYDRLAEVYRRIKGPTMIELNDTHRFNTEEQKAELRTLLRNRLEPYYEHLDI